MVERGGRPVLRVPNPELFAPGDAVLKPEGKALLTQIAQALNGQLDTFELRVVSYTDTDAETTPAKGEKKDSSAKPAPAAADSKPRYPTSWDLTAARAATLARFYRDQTSLPFLNVLVLGRGDSEPIVSNAGEGHARNRRVEITVTPLPVGYHAPDPDHDKTGTSSATGSVSAASVAPKTPFANTSTSASAAKDKDKDKDKAKEKKSDKDAAH